MNNTLQILKKNYRVVAKLFRYSKNFRKSYLAALLINSLTMVRFSFIIGFSTQWVTDSALSGDWATFRIAMTYAVAVFVANAVLYYFEGYLMMSRVAMMMAGVKTDLYKKVLDLAPEYFDGSHSGDLQSRLSSDLAQAQEAISFTLVDPINFGMLGVVNLALIALNNWKMALICLGLVGLTVLCNSLFIKKLQTLNESIQENIAKTAERYSDILNAIPLLRVFSMQQWVFTRYDKENQKLVKDQKRVVKNSSLQESMNNLLNNVCSFVMLGIGAISLAYGELTVGALLAIFRYVNTLVFSATGFGSVMTNITKSIVSAERVLAILDYVEEGNRLEQQTKNKTTQTNTTAAVSFQDVTFSYQNNAPVLKHLSFTLEQGKSLALVGTSGAGKSTILDVLMGFYSSESTCKGIKVYGKAIGEYPLEELREKIAYILQNSYFFDGTIRDNIAYGKSGATDAEIEAAAEAAKAHDFIMGLPDGYNTKMGENGAFLSGGEKQRIAIARAFLKDAPILLMDEPTSALDSQTEAAIQESLGELMEGRTVIVAAHRLSTIQNAGIIAVLEDGRIVEHGTHSDLLHQGGVYANNWCLLSGTKGENSFPSVDD